MLLGVNHLDCFEAPVCPSGYSLLSDLTFDVSAKRYYSPEGWSH